MACFDSVRDVMFITNIMLKASKIFMNWGDINVWCDGISGENRLYKAMAKNKKTKRQYIFFVTCGNNTNEETRVVFYSDKDRTKAIAWSNKPQSIEKMLKDAEKKESQITGTQLS